MKNGKRIFFICLLAVSLCLNITLTGILGYKIQLWDSRSNTEISHGTYIKNPEQRGVNNTYFVFNAEATPSGKASNGEFYYYTNLEKLATGSYQIDGGGFCTLYNEDGSICGFVTLRDWNTIQVIWMDGSHLALERYADSAALPGN